MKLIVILPLLLLSVVNKVSCRDVESKKEAIHTRTLESKDLQPGTFALLTN